VLLDLQNSLYGLGGREILTKFGSEHIDVGLEAKAIVKKYT
jgi:hypothetical protein